MAYRTLLVSLNDTEKLDNFLEAAARLGTEHDAHIIGLFVIPGPTIYAAAGPYAVPALFDALTRAFEEQAPRTRERFEGVMRRNGLASQWLEARAVTSDISETVNDIGRTADLVVIGNGGRDGEVEPGFAASVVMGVGRPTLILPRNATAGLEFSQIICGYDRSREASRAIHDALPILTKAADVRLVWVDPSKDEQAAGPLPGADMAASLARHGVKATAESMPTTGINPAQALFTRARDLGAGLIVMGAYGHSRLHEFVLGGATRHALANIAVPLLMAH